jgi:hypothetical protein
MPDDQKKDAKRLHPETFFLPPLKMVLAFFDKESRQHEKKKKETAEQEKTVEKNLEKLIEKLSEEDE